MPSLRQLETCRSQHPGHHGGSDALCRGRSFRTFNVIDESNREVLTIEVGASISAIRITRVHDQVIELYGKPQALRIDNGPEFTSGWSQRWCGGRDITPMYIQPGNPDRLKCCQFTQGAMTSQTSSFNSVRNGFRCRTFTH